MIVSSVKSMLFTYQMAKSFPLISKWYTRAHAHKHTHTLTYITWDINGHPVNTQWVFYKPVKDPKNGSLAIYLNKAKY